MLVVIIMGTVMLEIVSAYPITITIVIVPLLAVST